MLRYAKWIDVWQIATQIGIVASRVLLLAVFQALGCRPHQARFCDWGGSEVREPQSTFTGSVPSLRSPFPYVQNLRQESHKVALFAKTKVSKLGEVWHRTKVAP